MISPQAQATHPVRGSSQWSYFYDVIQPSFYHNTRPLPGRAQRSWRSFLRAASWVPIYQQYLGEAGNQAFTYEVFADAGHNIRIGGNFADGYFDLMVNWLRNLPMGIAE